MQLTITDQYPKASKIGKVILRATNTNNNLSARLVLMTSLNGNVFRVTGPLWGESIGHRWIPLTNASDADFLYFLRSVLGQTVEQTIETAVIWVAIGLIMSSL